MTKYILLISLLCIAACTPQQPKPLMQCAPLGIDVTQPNFYQKHKLTDIEQFYDCMEGNARIAGTSTTFSERLVIIAKGTNITEKHTANVIMALEYQRNLWREVLDKEKKPGAAYEAWIAWFQKERAIKASNASAEAARQAARAASRSTNTTCMANGPLLNCTSN